MDILEYENAVAGAILIAPECLPLAAKELKREDFALQSARAVFETAAELSSEGRLIDALTIFERAGQKGLKLTKSFLIELMESTPSAANIGEYIRIVRAESLKRKLLELSRSAEESIFSGEAAETVLSGLYGSLGKLIESSGAANGTYNSAELFGEWLDFRKGRLNDPSLAAVGTGYALLDDILSGGMVNGGLYIIGGRPGMGKTTLGISMAFNIACAGKPVLFVSLEMSAVQIASKLIAIKGTLRYSDLYQGELGERDSKKAVCAASELSCLPFYLSCRPDMTVSEITLLARGIKGLSAVLVDYLGLIKPEGDKAPNRYEAMTEISNDLKRAAKTLNVPVICIAQLNRELASRKSKRPMLTDLRETGSIEQDADGVIFVHRPSYYECGEGLRNPGGELIEVIVAKNRHGGTGICEMVWFGGTGKICAGRGRKNEDRQFL